MSYHSPSITFVITIAKFVVKNHNQKSRHEKENKTFADFLLFDHSNLTFGNVTLIYV